MGRMLVSPCTFSRVAKTRLRSSSRRVSRLFSTSLASLLWRKARLKSLCEGSRCIPWYSSHATPVRMIQVSSLGLRRRSSALLSSSPSLGRNLSHNFRLARHRGTTPPTSTPPFDKKSMTQPAQEQFVSTLLQGPLREQFV